MGCWSAENATKAYLNTVKMGKTVKQPDIDEFISALAAGNNAQLMVAACGGPARSTTLALAEAAQQTGGRVICILTGKEELKMTKTTLGQNANRVEFVVGEARTLLTNHYGEADFVLIDCNLENHEEILGEMRSWEGQKGKIILGYNAFCKDSWKLSGLNTQLLPIGEGLLLSRIGKRNGDGKRRNWVVRIDEGTGEEHVFRVRSNPHGRVH